MVAAPVEQKKDAVKAPVQPAPVVNAAPTLESVAQQVKPAQPAPVKPTDAAKTQDAIKNDGGKPTDK